MPALQLTTLTANGTYIFPLPTGGKNAFQATVAIFGSLGAGTIAWSIVFYDAAGTAHALPIPAAGGAPPTAINTAGVLNCRADALQAVLTGATSPSLGVWIG